MQTLLIDNYDSFTNNLYQIISEINGIPPIIIKNDTISLEDLNNLQFDNIVISPGPGNPVNSHDFGFCNNVILTLDAPILGICLGHQGIAAAYGGVIKHAIEPMHGRLSNIIHNNDELFSGIPNNFRVTRYHSLIVSNCMLPDCIKAIAFSEDNEIMALRHTSKPQWGVQYHPESITTHFGKVLLENFMKLSSLRIKSITKNNNSSDMSGNIIYQCPQEKTKYKLLVRKINKHYKSEIIFKNIFSNSKDYVWLDGNLANKSLSRFSILASQNGPYSYQVKYNVLNKVITIIKNGVENTFSESIFEYLENQLKFSSVECEDKLPFNFKCGFIGYLGYELYKDCLGIEPKYNSPFPDANFLFIDRALVFDNHQNCLYLIALEKINDSNQAISWFNQISKELDRYEMMQKIIRKNEFVALNEKFSINKKNYIDNINNCLERIKDGDSYEICLTNQVEYSIKFDVTDFYLQLREQNKAPFSAILKFNDLVICSMSVERFLNIDSIGNVESKPIKGTLPRSIDLDEDGKLKTLLQSDKKFISENLMIVDLIRHDLGLVCEIGSVEVTKLMAVESFPTVHQLVSTIRGKLKKDTTSIECIKSMFPGGSMTGAPKKRTVEILRELETNARGIYSGAIGYISLDGAVDLSIVIRTGVINNSKLSIGVGGAIIAMSSPEDEYNEILLKLRGFKNLLKITRDL